MNNPNFNEENNIGSKILFGEIRLIGSTHMGKEEDVQKRGLGSEKIQRFGPIRQSCFK